MPGRRRNLQQRFAELRRSSETAEPDLGRRVRGISTTIKILALSFLILVGVTLMAEGIGFHIPKGYMYFAATFSAVVERLNLKVRRRGAVPVRLHKPLREHWGVCSRGRRGG